MNGFLTRLQPLVALLFDQMNIIKNLKTIWLINITINNEILKKNMKVLKALMNGLMKDNNKRKVIEDVNEIVLDLSDYRIIPIIKHYDNRLSYSTN
jgi:hypothetical protein